MQGIGEEGLVERLEWPGDESVAFRDDPLDSNAIDGRLRILASTILGRAQMGVPPLNDLFKFDHGAPGLTRGVAFDKRRQPGDRECMVMDPDQGARDIIPSALELVKAVLIKNRNAGRTVFVFLPLPDGQGVHEMKDQDVRIIRGPAPMRCFLRPSEKVSDEPEDEIPVLVLRYMQPADAHPPGSSRRIPRIL